jgi:hypothetical protein
MTAFDGHKVLHTCDQLVAWLECLFSIRFEIQEEGYSRNWRKVTEIETNRNHISTKMGMVSAGTREQQENICHRSTKIGADHERIRHELTRRKT